MKTINISETCVFLQISLSRMGDKRGVSSDDIEVDADKDRVKVRKVIFKSASFDAIKSLDSEIRRFVRAQCFPYDAGLHLVPLAMMEKITAQLEAYNIRRNELIDRFADVYPQIASDSQSKLRALHCQSDYDIENISSQFSMGWQFLQIVAPTNLEQVNSQIFIQERNKLQDRMKEAFEEARLILRETCLNLVTHLRLSLESDAHGAAKRLSTSTVTHLKEFLHNFDLRNVTNDRELELLIRQARQLTDGIDAESLRTLDSLRLRVRGELSTIEESISRSLIVEPKRRIRVS